jgi:hypothetical protein
MGREGRKILRVCVKTAAIIFNSQANLTISLLQPYGHLFGPRVADDIS